VTQTQEQSIVASPIDKQLQPHRRAPAACNDNSEGGSYCPHCNKPAITPVASEYCGDGLIHHRWLCAACGHDWVIATRVPSYW
jgi:transposase-like protein